MPNSNSRRGPGNGRSTGLRAIRLRGFSIVEMLAVVGIIAVLLAILLPALRSARRNTLWAQSQTNLRTVGQLLTLYIQDNRDIIAPTAFDYAPNNTHEEFARAGNVRSASPTGTAPPIGELHAGSWTDILWTSAKFEPIVNYGENASPWNYRFDSPDCVLYASGWSGSNPFRSAEAMQSLAGDGTGATPLGGGPGNGGPTSPQTGTGERISERADPGYFGGNPFFDARAPTSGRPYSGSYWSLGQIKRPESSMYCTDSNLGELLEVNDPTLNPNNPDLDLTGVEWRYTGRNCIMLFLDGHVDTIGQWENLRELETELGVRVFGLDQRSFFP